ncbi:response regulator [Phormidesmis sp. 146-12]
MLISDFSPFDTSASSNSQRLQLSPSIAYYIRKLLYQNLAQLKSVVATGPALRADDFCDLDRVIVSLYLDTQEINSIIHQLEQLTLSHKALTTQGAIYLGDAQTIEEKIFWLLGYKLDRSTYLGTVLVIDDAPVDTRIVSIMLKRQGYQVCSATNGQMALKLLSEVVPDLILLDVMMPGIDGYEVCKRLKACPKTQDIPVMFLSSADVTSEKVRAFELGGADYITKPFRPDEVLARIKYQLQVRDRHKCLTEQSLRLEQEIKERRQAEECYRSFFEHSMDGKFQSTPDGRFLRVNPALAKFYHYESPDDLIATIVNIEEQLYVQSDRRAEFIAQIEKMGTVSNFESQVRRKDGTVIWISENVRAIRDKYDNLLFYEGTVKDITAYKETELALDQNQQLLHHLIDNTNALIFAKEYLHTDGSYLLINRKFASEFDLDLNAYSGKTDYDLFPAAIAQAFRQADQRVLESRCPIQVEEVASYHGKLRTSLVIKFPLFNTDGQIYAVCGIATDIDDRKQAESALKSSERLLRQQTQHLQQTLITLQQTQTTLFQQEQLSSLRLIAGITEEIQTPINFIDSHLQWVDQQVQAIVQLLMQYQQTYPDWMVKVSAPAKVDIDYLVQFPKLTTKLREGSRQIRQVASALWHFSDLDEVEEKVIDIHQCIDNSLLLLSHRLRQTPQHPQIEVIQAYDWLPEVKCYPGQLHQVLMHLLNNAIDAFDLPNCRPETLCRITICTEQTGDAITIHISDNGCGIPLEIQPRIFEPFFTTKPDRQHCGMGLSICYQAIVIKHHGQIQCSSVWGEGAKFTIVLPSDRPAI